MEPIHIFRPKFRTDEIIEELRDCFDKGWTGMGYKTVEFEDAWSEYTKLENSYFISSNTVGLHLALRVLKQIEGWSDGDEIVTTPLTFVSTNHTILYENLKPVFADVDETLCLDPVSVINKINNKTRAVMFVGMGGNSGKLDQIANICKENDLKLILDAAHMAGTFVNYDKEGEPLHVGHEADVTVFSFQAVKNLPTADSGMICFRDSNNLELCRKLGWLGIDKDTFSRLSGKGIYNWKYEVPEIGFKYHGNSVMASIGLVQLKYLDQDNINRNVLAKIYDKLLSEKNKIIIIDKSEYCFRSSRHLYQIRISDPSRKKGKNLRDKVVEYMHKKNIFPGVHYRDNTTYPMYKYAEGECPNARTYSKEILSLPLHLGLKEEDVFRVVEVLMHGVRSQ